MHTLKYRKRLIESQIEKKMSYSGGIIIEGAKWVGKSTTAEIFSSTVIKPVSYTHLSISFLSVIPTILRVSATLSNTVMSSTRL